MADLTGFDANQHEPTVAFDCIPAGDYDVIITSSAMEPTKDGKGKFLKLELQVLNGPFQNRKLFDRLNLVNANETAMKIARGMLSAICRAVGVLTPKDSSELHNKPLTAKVAVKRADAKYDEANEIKGYKPRGSTTAPTQNTAAGNPGQVASGSPWKL